MAESADFRRGKRGRVSRSGDERGLQGAEAGVPAGVRNSALSNHISSVGSGGVNGGDEFGAEAEDWRCRREGGMGVWIGAWGCTNINRGLVVPAVLRASWGWWWSAEGALELDLDELGTGIVDDGLDSGDEWAAEDADERLERLEDIEVEVEE